jgi:TolA-binding protein
LAAFTASLAAEPVGGYVAYRAAEVAAESGDLNASGDLYRQARDLGLSGWWAASAARRVARIYTVARQPAEAIGWLERAESVATEIERRALPVWYDGELVRRNGEAARTPILLELGRARWEAGLIDEAIDAYSDVVAFYPASDQADPALQALADMGALTAVTASARGLVHFHAGRPREAIAAFEEFRTAGSDEDRLARAAYYTGLARRNAGDRAGARAELYRMAETYPGNSLAPEALWQAARIAESNGAPPSNVVGAYLMVADTYPASEQAARALARAGIVSLKAGDATGSRGIWGRLANHPNAAARAEGLLALGRNSLVAGNAADASADLSEAGALAPYTYDGVRARDLIERGLGDVKFVVYG